MIDHLPHESSLKTKLRDALDPEDLAERASQPGKGFGPWSHTDYLLAALADRLDQVIVATYKASGRYKPSQPTPYPRPGIVPEGDKAIPAEVRERFEQMRAELRATQEAARKAKEEAGPDG